MSPVLPTQTTNWEQASWQEGYTAVKQFADRLGAPVDEGISETVVVLNLLGFRTYQSCEGHLDHGCPYPWADVIDAERFSRYKNMWIHVCDLEKQAKEAKTVEVYEQYLSADIHLRTLAVRWEAEDPIFKRLVALLDAFYVDQSEQNPVRLLVKKREPGMYRMAPGFSASVRDIPDDLKAAYLARGQAEMQALTGFLKRQWQARRSIEIA
ncbi:MAG: hypothetical protein H0W02_02080 [Ktedonobacteraceae bacterium]|nr:hypothetical protein [Ktedonobacteraceae bacterium]